VSQFCTHDDEDYVPRSFCKWESWYRGPHGYYLAECNGTNESVYEEGFKFCPYCGRELEIDEEPCDEEELL